MMQSFVLMAVVSVVWAVIGYSLAFDTGNFFIGGFKYAFLQQRRRRPLATTPPPSRTRPGWSISSCSPSSRPP